MRQNFTFETSSRPRTEFTKKNFQIEQIEENAQITKSREKATIPLTQHKGNNTAQMEKTEGADRASGEFHPLDDNVKSKSNAWNKLQRTKCRTVKDQHRGRVT